MVATFSQLRDPGPNPKPGELPEPGGPATERECAPNSPAQSVLRTNKDVEFAVGEESGPVAVSEGELASPVEGYDLTAMISLVDLDGQWRDLIYFPVDPQFEEEPNADADPAAVVEELVAAVKSGDCEGVDIFDPFSRLTSGKQGDAGQLAACKALVDGSYFGPSVKETPEEDLEPEELIFARDIALYGVPTKEAYYVVTMFTPPTEPEAPPQATFRVTEVNVLTEAEPG
jgi:hypothetical protein